MVMLCILWEGRKEELPAVIGSINGNFDRCGNQPVLHGIQYGFKRSALIMNSTSHFLS